MVSFLNAEEPLRFVDVGQGNWDIADAGYGIEVDGIKVTFFKRNYIKNKIVDVYFEHALGKEFLLKKGVVKIEDSSFEFLFDKENFPYYLLQIRSKDREAIVLALLPSNSYSN